MDRLRPLRQASDGQSPDPPAGPSPCIAGPGAGRDPEAGTAIANRSNSIITADRDFEEIAKTADIDVTFYSRR